MIGWGSIWGDAPGWYRLSLWDKGMMAGGEGSLLGGGRVRRVEVSGACGEMSGGTPLLLWGLFGEGGLGEGVKKGESGNWQRGKGAYGWGVSDPPCHERCNCC